MAINHTIRKTSIGGSEIAAMLGLCEYQSPYGLWLSKTGRAEPFMGNADTRRGKAMEPALIQLLAYELEPQGFKIIPWDETVTREIDGYTYFSSPDAGIEHEAYADGGAELKTYAGYLPTLEAVEEKKPGWLLQCQHCMNITGRTWWVLCWMDSTWALHYEFIAADPILQAKIIKEIRTWWDSYVVTDTPPPFDRPLDFAAIAGNGDYRETSPDMYIFLQELREKKSQLSQLEQEISLDSDAVKMAIGLSDGLTYGGRKAVSWKMNRAGSRVFRLNI